MINGPTKTPQRVTLFRTLAAAGYVSRRAVVETRYTRNADRVKKPGEISSAILRTSRWYSHVRYARVH